MRWLLQFFAAGINRIPVLGLKILPKSQNNPWTPIYRRTATTDGTARSLFIPEVLSDKDIDKFRKRFTSFRRKT